MSTFTRILSIDGGGIRGIIPGQILIALEDKLKQHSRNQDARLADYFDLIAGTSTGGILTCLYLCPDEEGTISTKYSAAAAVDLYLKHGRDIFKSSIWQKLKSFAGLGDEKYDEKSLEALIRQFIGDLYLSDLIKPCLITAYDIEKRKTTFFTQHDAVLNSEKNFPLLHVARSTSAAPTYFQVARATSATNAGYSLIDGGVFANNPALCAYAEVRTKFKHHPTAKDMLMLSLSTGHVRKEYKYRKAKNWGMVGWLRPLLDILMAGVSETVDYQLRQIFASVNKPDQYLRINEPLQHADSSMDNASAKNLAALQQEGQEIAQKYDAELTRFVEMLLA
ncbi:patatin [candidate division KSB1 bacterium]|nr:patatin-like phospholipase family protein [candidate division KSB1 bacterium]RQV99755.1 MAG: patatin [candidate division KSB1 bacterium]